MIDLIRFVYDEACEAELASLLAEDLAAGCLPDARDLRALLKPRRREIPDDVLVTFTALVHFDALLEARAWVE